MNPLSQASIYGLLVAQLLAMLGHLVHAPLWLFGLWAGCALWRLQMARQRVGLVKGWAKCCLIGITCVGVYLSRGSMIGLDAGVVLLIAAFALKMLEARTVRDAQVIVFLGFFVVLTGYLFESALWMALYSLLPITALLSVLVGLYSQHLARHPRLAVKKAGVLLLQALPLMLVLFVLFPRIGPLWSMPMPSDKRLTGLSERMAPADIAELSQSSALAFRATFKEQVPDRAALYWRALTLEHFDGRQWSQVRSFAPTPEFAMQGPSIDYSVLMQPHAKNWLFVLDVAEPQGMGRLLSNFSVQRRRPVDQAVLYDMRAWPSAVRDKDRAPGTHLLQLPREGDPRSRAFATRLQGEYPDAHALVKALMQHFSQAPFAYTLRPGVLGEDSIDSFLFETQRGFCAHYAGAMTFVLRAAGIPSRVVAGYQGGELTGDPQTVQVRQFDAHAWVEYWQADTGWVRVDPTFAVAPSRIEHGLEQAVSQEDTFLQQSPFSPLKFRDVGWLNQMRLSWDQLNHSWQRWVLGFDQGNQQQLWKKWFGTIGAYWPLVTLGSVLMLGLAISAWLLLRSKQSALNPLQKRHRQFEALLAQHGLVRGRGEGPMDFAQRAGVQLPHAQRAIQTFAVRFQRICYGADPNLSALHADLSALKAALAHSRQ